EREAARARQLAVGGVPAAGATFGMAHDPLTRGERVFARECMGCHTFEGRGPEKPKAPDLTGYRSKAWIRQVFRDPDAKRMFGLTKVEGMKSIADKPKEDVDKLVDLIYAQRDANAPPVASRAGADLLDSLDCTNCHELEKDESLEAPSLHRYGTRE